MINKLLQNQTKNIFRRQQGTRSTVLVDLPGYEQQDQPTAFKARDQAPFAYNKYYEFPDDYRPESLNYRGNGLFLGLFSAFVFSAIMYEKDYLARTGQTRRKPEKQYYQP